MTIHSWKEKMIGLQIPETIMNLEWSGDEDESYGMDKYGIEWIQQKTENGVIFCCQIASEFRDRVHLDITIQTDKQYIKKIELEAIEHDCHGMGPAYIDRPMKKEEHQIGRYLKPLFGIK